MLTTCFCNSPHLFNLEISNLPQSFTPASVGRLAKHTKYWTCYVIKIFTLYDRKNLYFHYFHNFIRFFNSMSEPFCIILQIHHFWIREKTDVLHLEPGTERKLCLCGSMMTTLAKKTHQTWLIKSFSFFFIGFLLFAIIPPSDRNKPKLYSVLTRKKNRKKGHVLSCAERKVVKIKYPSALTTCKVVIYIIVKTVL